MKRFLSVVAMVLALAVSAHAQVLMPGPSSTLLNAVTATTTATGFPMAGYGITAFQVTAPALSTGTVVFQGSLDNTNWAVLGCVQQGLTSPIISQVVASNLSVATSVMVQCQTDGIAMVRAVLSPYVAGTFTVTSSVSAMPRTK